MSKEPERYFHLGEVRDYEVRARKKALLNHQITQTDSNLIDQYLAEKQARDQIGRQRVLKINTILLGWRENFLPVEYAVMTMGDFYQAIQKANTAPCQTGKSLAQNTRRDYVIIIKPFLVWMIENNINCNLDEKKIRSVKNPAKNTRTTHPDDILNPDEITRMISSCKSTRDRALIAVQYEAATRIGELGHLTWRDVEFDNYGSKLYITDTKTNKSRNARLTDAISSRYLATWKGDYPGIPEGENPVFLSERGGPLTYYAIRKIFIEAAKRANIEKKVKTHLFRKSRGTHLIEQGLPISNVIELMWGNQGTRMIETYIQLSPVEQDRVMLKHAGILTDEQSKASERRISGSMCTICHTQNSPTARYCCGCGTTLTEEAQIKQKILLEQTKDPMFLQEIMTKLSELQNKGIIS